MKTDTLKTREILERSCQFMASCCNRSYCWEKEQLDKVWLPVVEIARDEAASPHFFGIMLTQPEPWNMEVSKITLHDGYQRLMTIFVFLSLIRDLERANGQAVVADEIHDNYLVNRYVEQKENFMKLVPTEDDQEAFKQLVIGGEKISGSRIFNAYDFFKEKIKTSGIPINKIMNVILDFSFAIIILDNNDDPFQIWKTLPPQCRQLRKSISKPAMMT